MQDPARPELFTKPWILGIVRVLRLFLGIQMVKVSEKLIEAVNTWQMLIAITKMILTELRGCVSLCLQNIGNAWVILGQAQRGARKTNFGQPGSNRRLPCNKCSTACSATLLAVPAEKHRAFFSDSIDVRSFITHVAAIVDTCVVPSNDIPHDD